VTATGSTTPFLTYGEALLAADHRRMNSTSAIGLDETSFVRLGTKAHTAYATAVADVEHHQIIEVAQPDLHRVAAWLDKQPKGCKERIVYGALDISSAYAAVYWVALPEATQVIDPFHVISLAKLPRCAAKTAAERTDGTSRPARRSALSGPARPAGWRGDPRREGGRAPVVTARIG
jgi:transposase